jgi:alkanesulfonate monooxygenase SsuD/methylene tetrahydromethanopterin reductase-like flavin-dependent oxidoreductase (luciferase family)
MDRNRGQAGPLLSPEMAVADLNADQKAEMQFMREQALVGNAEETADKLRVLARSLSLDELVVCTWTHDPAVQSRSFELLAQAFDMTALPAPSERAFA